MVDDIIKMEDNNRRKIWSGSKHLPSTKHAEENELKLDATTGSGAYRKISVRKIHNQLKTPKARRKGREILRDQKEYKEVKHRMAKVEALEDSTSPRDLWVTATEVDKRIEFETAIEEAALEQGKLDL